MRRLHPAVAAGNHDQPDQGGQTQNEEQVVERHTAQEEQQDENYKNDGEDDPLPSLMRPAQKPELPVWLAYSSHVSNTGHLRQTA